MPRRSGAALGDLHRVTGFPSVTFEVGDGVQCPAASAPAARTTRRSGTPRNREHQRVHQAHHGRHRPPQDLETSRAMRSSSGAPRRRPRSGDVETQLAPKVSRNLPEVEQPYGLLALVRPRSPKSAASHHDGGGSAYPPIRASIGCRTSARRRRCREAQHQSGKVVRGGRLIPDHGRAVRLGDARGEVDDQRVRRTLGHDPGGATVRTAGWSRGARRRAPGFLSPGSPRCADHRSPRHAGESSAPLRPPGRRARERRRGLPDSRRRPLTRPAEMRSRTNGSSTTAAERRPPASRDMKRKAGPERRHRG
jgi:hypothetical protein